MLDIIFEIALRTDYQTTLILLDLYPKIKRDDFWNLKWQNMYPDKKYFEFWDRKTNYLIQYHKNFDFFVGMGIYQRTIYLSDTKIEHKKYEDVAHECHYGKYFVAIPFLEDQFILVRDDSDNIVSVIGQFPTKELAVQYMEKDFPNHTKPGLYGKRQCNYNIFDISNMKISFELKPDIVFKSESCKWQSFYSGVNISYDKIYFLSTKVIHTRFQS